MAETGGRRAAYRANAILTGASARARTRYYLARYGFVFEKVGPGAAIGARFRIKPIAVFSDKLLRVTLGHHVNFEPGVTIQGQGAVSIGDWSTIGSNVVIGCSDRVTIGVAALIARRRGPQDRQTRMLAFCHLRGRLALPRRRADGPPRVMLMPD